MITDAYYWDILIELDSLDRSLSDWEIDFLESVLSQTNLTFRQKEVIDKMKEKYLG